MYLRSDPKALNWIFSLVNIKGVNFVEISRCERFIQWWTQFANKRFCWFNEGICGRKNEASNCCSSNICTRNHPMICTLQLPIADNLQNWMFISKVGNKNWLKITDANAGKEFRSLPHNMSKYSWIYQNKLFFSFFPRNPSSTLESFSLEICGKRN